MRYLVFVVAVLSLLSCRRGEYIPPVFKHPFAPYPGTYNYKYYSERLASGYYERHEINFRLVVDDELKHRVEISSLKLYHNSILHADVMLSAACREAFHGNNTFMGTFALDDSRNIADIIPPCIDEVWMERLIELVYILRVQGTNYFNLNGLSKDKYQADFVPFADSWSQPPALLTARLHNPGGDITWQQLDKIAYIAVRPTEMIREKLYAGGAGNYLFANNAQWNLFMDIKDSGILTSVYMGGVDHLWRWNIDTMSRIPPRSEYLQDTNKILVESYMTRKLTRR